MRESSLKKVWRFLSNIDTVRGLFGLLVGSTAAYRSVTGMVEAWLENPFEPLMWFFGGWFCVAAAASGAKLAWFALPSNRFHALTEDARYLSREIGSRLEKVDDEWYVLDPELRERVLTLKSRLEDLGVSVPSTDNFNPINWYYWLPKLVSWADTKNLYEARTYDARRLGGDRLTGGS